MNLEQLKQFLTYLQKDNMIAGPVMAGEVLNFKEIENIDDLELTNKIPLHSFKKFLLPAREVLTTPDPSLLRMGNTPPVSPSQGGLTPLPAMSGTSKRGKIGMALVGLTSPDLRAITILNHIFEKDPYYQERIKKTLIIGYAEVPDEYKGMFAVRYEENILEHLQFDIFIVEEKFPSPLYKKGKNMYKIFTGSEDGQKVLDKFGYSNYENVQFAGLIPEEGVSKEMLKVRKTMDKMSPQNEIFQELGKKCIECGRCSIICPLCFCFCLEEHTPDPSQEGNLSCGRDAFQCASTMKERKSTTCFYSQFSEVAGGHKFLKNPAERIFHWYDHKFVRFPEDLAVAGGVSCGRCAKVCPAGIDIKKVMKGILDFRF
ncbi:MAG: 4Fe-4S dicluster domain-containing protein [bacterium]